MKNSTFRVELLNSSHTNRVINSGSEALDRYFREQVTQDIRRRVASCFVLLSNEEKIIGYYTLSASSLSLADLPLSVSKKLPRYPSVPVVCMGRLAIDQAFKGLGLGSALLADALDRAARSEIAAFAMMVDAKDDSAVTFYQHHGFIGLPLSPRTLFLPLAIIHRFGVH